MQQEIAAYGDWDAQLLEIHAGQLDLIQNNENIQTIMVKGDNQTALLPAASELYPLSRTQEILVAPIFRQL